MRKRAVILFAVFLAAGSCPTDQCGGGSCQSTTTSQTVGILAPNASDGQNAFNCKTCTHTTANATWASSGGAGSIELKMHAECGGGAVVGTEYTSTAAPNSGTVSISNEPAPAECVSTDATVSWFVTVTNKSDQTIGDVVTRITCPTSQSSGTAGPSQIRVK